MFAVRLASFGSRILLWVRVVSKDGRRGGAALSVSAILGLALLTLAAVPAQAQTTAADHATTASAKTASRKKTRHTAHRATRRTTAHREAHRTIHTPHTTRTRLSSRELRLRREREAAYRRRHYRYRHHHVLTARERARSRRLHRAFIASAQLMPMAQQLAQMRTPAAYAGVTRYARTHTGDAAAAAYLALGNAYLLDHRFADAEFSLRLARRSAANGVLDDYADYLTAQVYLQSNQLPQAEAVLSTFVKKYPDSIFDASVPVLRANLYLQENNPREALTILNAHEGDPAAGQPGFQLALARADLMAGNTAEAQRLFEHVYLSYPLSGEADYARVQMESSGAMALLPPAERRRHADALYAAGRYEQAGEEYRELAAQSDTDGVSRIWLLVAAAECDWKRGLLSQRELDQIPQTDDEAGARRMYLEMELARDAGDTSKVQALVGQMERRFPDSMWLGEALFSSGNMYLLAKNYPSAIDAYSELARRFPASHYASDAHWRAAWLTYRMGDWRQAALQFDAQLRLYPHEDNSSAALYWRGVIFQTDEHNAPAAAAYYETVARVFPHYYHAMLAEQRLKAMGPVAPEPIAFLGQFHREDIPELTDDVPEDDPHVVKAKLLANAGLNQYIAPEIRAADGSDEWGAFAEAEIFAQDGQAWRAMELLKRELPFYTSAPIDAIPLAYWRILYPTPYWPEIKAASAANGLDPYMVASLIRQETEFNPKAISGSDAYGLMQLLPRVGRQMARQLGMRYFRTDDLLNPDINIELGTRYLKQMLDEFGGTPEYAFAAYNAGDNRVTAWRSDGTYDGMDEFVESIPFTQTRNYVQAIVRNEAIYRELEEVRGAGTTSAREEADDRGY